ncbi:hypothetical protein ACHQM5_003502 [Ranunculus cassubicifolius]
MASFNLPSPQSPFLQKSKPLSSSSFLGEIICLKPSIKLHKPIPSTCKITSKFDLFQILGGRGLCNGEEGLSKLLNTPVVNTPPAEEQTDNSPTSSSSSVDIQLPENAFNKELSGLTGGFPGGEKGLESFLEKNPPPPKKNPSSSSSAILDLGGSKAKPPEMPLLMPGMIVIVKNERNPYHMYCGIIQRITDGHAGVLFEGGNWDKLLSFRLEELERREKGPPMVNPKSAIIESLAKQDS